MTEHIISAVEGSVGQLQLNRPEAIHALSHPMCSAMLAQLVAWRHDPDVALVTIDHAAGRGFCAGGDVRALGASGAGDGREARAFFHEEYRLNHLLFTYPKPVVAFMDGIVMGGGVGISQPARFRVATEGTRFAMPETAIGLFPDVGGGWYLSRLPGRVGQFLALTGERLDGAECVHLGLATHYVPAERLPALKKAIVGAPDRVEASLDEAAAGPPPARIAESRADIDRLFAADRLEDVLAALEADGGEWARKELTTLRTKSPQACKVSLRLLAEGARRGDFLDEMRAEYALAARVVVRPDFPEGVRAVLVDKDGAPRWDPATPEGVTQELIDGLFAPLPDGEAWTPVETTR